MANLKNDFQIHRAISNDGTEIAGRVQRRPTAGSSTPPISSTDSAQYVAQHIARFFSRR